MKTIMIILLGVMVYSCNKKVNSKEIILEKLEKDIEDEIKINFIFSTQTEGVLSIYRYNKQSPDTVINLTELVYSNILIEDEVPYYSSTIILNYLREEIKKCNGRFYVKIEFDTNIYFVMNQNYFNSETTYGSNIIFPEPSTKTSFNTSSFENSFWIKYENKPIRKKGNYESY